MTGPAVTVATVRTTFTDMADRYGLSVAILLSVVLWSMLVDAGWVPSKSREAVKLVEQQTVQIAELAKAIGKLADSVVDISKEQGRQTRNMRELMCYGLVKDKDLLRQCLVGASG